MNEGNLIKQYPYIGHKYYTSTKAKPTFIDEYNKFTMAQTNDLSTMTTNRSMNKHVLYNKLSILNIVFKKVNRPPKHGYQKQERKI